VGLLSVDPIGVKPELDRGEEEEGESGDGGELITDPWLFCLSKKKSHFHGF